MDEPAVAALRSLLHEYVATLPEGVCQDEPVEQALEVYRSQLYGAWVALHKGNGIGCVGLRLLDLDTARIERLFVQPRFRRAGVARSLCRTALRHAVRQELRRVVLDTLPQMVEAQHLYRSFGFVATAEPDWTGCDAQDRVYMELLLAR